MSARHIITSEYPPQLGGVSDYSYLVASGLAASGEVVHVWCPSGEGEETMAADVTVHREMGRITLRDLKRVGRALDRYPAPRRLLVQWVPHGYSRRAMNLPFCLWLWKRARISRDVVDVMIHETFLPFRRLTLKQNVVGVVQRVMTAVLLNAARRVFVTIPGWGPRLNAYLLGRKLTFEWLPVPSNIQSVSDPAGVERARREYAPQGETIIGHFGTYGREVSDLLLASMPPLLSSTPHYVALLMGRGSCDFRERLVREHPGLAPRVHATGTLSAPDLSRNVSCCDVMLQPYPDGISTRRTSAMTVLSHGIPLVTTTGQLTETLWEESKAVALVPVNRADELAEAVVRVLRDAQLRRHLKESGSALYEERFSIKQLIESFRGNGKPLDATYTR